ncbi:MAG: Flp pilus assembly complex ATPase component TadA [Candidatus Wildermuthbacteria bacterium]|nr:Flp pilus assembly complex ATPase component TadA [Candidatus Wildermuthbacteria bacterium]
MNIIQLLVQKNIIDKEKAGLLLEEARSSGLRAEEVILKEKIVAEDFLFQLKSESLKVPLVQVTPKDIPLKVLELIPEDSAKYYRMIPFAKQEDALDIGMVYPEDPKAQEALKFLARQGNFSSRVSLILPSVLDSVLHQYRSLKAGGTQALQELEEEIKKGWDDRTPSGPAELQRLVEEAPITKMVAVILRNAVEGKASDIHIEPTKDNLRVRFRLLGELYSSLMLPKRIHQAIVSRVKILANLKIDEMRVPQDGRFSTAIDDKAIDFRVSTFPTALGEKVAIRVLDPAAGLKSFKELGLEGKNLSWTNEAIQRAYGLILVTGPTGSGKTTTLYAILRVLNKEGVNIVSLEDPVEYLIEGMNQSQIRPEIGYDFPQGLRQILRQDPDVIMVGEVRDAETASLVIHSALTGHIVLSTLHTNNAIGAIPRLLDMGVDRYLISPSVSLVISQRLVRRLCDTCKEKQEPSKEVAEFVSKEIEKAPLHIQKRTAALLGGKENKMSVFVPKGCKACGGSGFSGRIGIFEVLTMTSELQEIILKDPSEANIAKEAKRQGMATMRQDGMIKVLDGVTTIEEVLRETEA